MRYQNGLHQVLLLRANDLGFHANDNERGIPAISASAIDGRL